MSAELIPLDELADRLGLTTNPAEYVTERGFDILTAWDGAAAVAVPTAAALVEELHRIAERDGASPAIPLGHE